MTTYTIQPARYAKGPRYVVTVGEAESQSFKKGQFVYLSSGLATEVADDGTTILGMAMHDASGTTSADVQVILATPSTQFEMTIWEDGGGTNDTYAVTDRGIKYAIEEVSDVHCINTSDTTHDALVIVEPLNPYCDAGDIYPRVLVSVIPAAYQGGAAAT